MRVEIDRVRYFMILMRGLFFMMISILQMGRAGRRLEWRNLQVEQGWVVEIRMWRSHPAGVDWFARGRCLRGLRRRGHHRGRGLLALLPSFHLR